MYLYICQKLSIDTYIKLKLYTMKSLLTKSTWILSLGLLLSSCGGKESKKATTEEVPAEASKTKTLDIEKPQLTFGFIKLTDMAPLQKKKVFLKRKVYLCLLKHNQIGKTY